ncbi:MAG: site-2 protease family protein, partial [Oscillospiraceae bacterium]|nr:site-2 protease family protein [Oscillospiraceae bacterium]
FNLIPIPPFDGSRIFNYFLSDKMYFKIMEYERYIFIGLLLVLFTGVLNGPLSILSGLVFNALDKLTKIVDVFGRSIFF